MNQYAPLRILGLAVLPVVILCLAACSKKPESTSAPASPTEAKAAKRTKATDPFLAEADAKVDAIRKAGEPVTLAEMDAWYAAPPQGADAAPAYAEAFDRIVPAPTNALVLPLFTTYPMPDGNAPLPAGVKQAITAHLARNKAALDALQKPIAIEKARYPADFKLGYNTLLPHLTHIRATGRLLRLDSALNADNGRMDAAAQSILAQLALGRSLAEEPAMLSQIIRFALEGGAVSSAEWMINRRPLNADQLTKLASAFRNAEDSTGLERGLIGDRCTVIQFYRMKPEERAEIARSFGGGPPTAGSDPAGLAEDFNHYLDAIAAVIAAARTPHPRRLEVSAKLAERRAEAKAKGWFAAALLEGSERVLVRDATTAARLALARTAFAIEQHRLANKSKLPAALAELRPAHLDEIPTDPFDGHPLRFKLLTRGYVVYSVGENRKDDGGAGAQPGSTNAPPDLVFTVTR